MSLFKRGNTYWVRFTTPNGKRIRESARTSDKKQAQEYHDRLKARYWRMGQLGDQPRRTWQEAVVRWLEDTDYKRDHVKDIGKLAWLDQFFHHCYLDEIKRDLIDQVAKVKKDEASPSTANRYKALIRAILRMARDEWEWLDRVPKVRMYPEPRKRVRWITHEEAGRLLAELPVHLKAMAAFTLATGLRQRNCSLLRWDQVDLDRAMAWIHADEAKSGKAIAVPLNADAMEVLRHQRGQHAEYVFVFRDHPVERTTTKAWHLALRRAGIEDFRWHDLRHTWASWHVQRGTSLYELKELGGWSTLEMVQRYAHLAAEHLASAAANIEGTKLAHSDKKGGFGHLKLVVSH